MRTKKYLYNKPMSEELKKKIKEMFDAGYSPLKIAYLTNYSLMSVYKVIGGKMREKRKEEIAKQIAKLRIARKTQREIAERLGISEISVRKYLKYALQKNYLTPEQNVRCRCKKLCSSKK